MQRIDINLRPSIQLITLMLLTLLGSLVIVAITPLMIWIKIILFISVIIYSAGIFWHHGLLKARQAIIAIHANESGWWIQDRQAKIAVSVNGDSTVTSILSVLRFVPIGQPDVRTCVIFKDSIEHDAYRRLVMALMSIDQ